MGELEDHPAQAVFSDIEWKEGFLLYVTKYSNKSLFAFYYSKES